MTGRLPVSVEVYTETHRMLGRMMPGTAGLFAYLNLPTRSVVELEGAHINRLHQPARLIARYARMWLRKEEILAVVLSNRNEVGPVSVARGGYSTVIPHRVHLMLEGFELRGTYESPGKLDLDSFFVGGERVFTPIYDALLEAILFPDIRAESPAILFNAHRLDAVAQLPREE